jgi:hypothetical protein
MVEKCYECGVPCHNGAVYCINCQLEDDSTVQLQLYQAEAS